MSGGFVFMITVILLSIYFLGMFLVVTKYDKELRRLDEADLPLIILWPVTIWFLMIYRKHIIKNEFNKWMDSL